MSVTPDRGNHRKSISGIFSALTNNVTPLRKYRIYPKNGTKPHYEVSESTDTDHYHGDKDTEHTEEKK